MICLAQACVVETLERERETWEWERSERERRLMFKEDEVVKCSIHSTLYSLLSSVTSLCRNDLILQREAVVGVYASSPKIPEDTTTLPDPEFRLAESFGA